MKRFLLPWLLAAAFAMGPGGGHQTQLAPESDVAAAEESVTSSSRRECAEGLIALHRVPNGDQAEPTEPYVNPEGTLEFSTVQCPDLPKRSLTLVECFALALENGRTGDFYDNPAGTQKTSVTGFSRQSTPGQVSDCIRVFAYEPAIAATSIEESQARFDVFHQTGLFWNRIDEQSRFLVPPTPSQEFFNRNKVDDVAFQSELFQRLATGGFAGVNFKTDYENNYLPPDSGILNPGYRPALEFSFEQPLLQGSGLLINQIRDFHPGSILQPNLPEIVPVPGLLVARGGRQGTALFVVGGSAATKGNGGTFSFGRAASARICSRTVASDSTRKS
jgi:hypothetical protein